MVALEAMERGRPVIASDVGGLPEIVVDGETGSSSRRATPTRSRGRSPSSPRTSRARLRSGAAGRARALAEFRQERCTERHEELYRAALARPLNRPTPARARRLRAPRAGSRTARGSAPCRRRPSPRACCRRAGAAPARGSAGARRSSRRARGRTGRARTAARRPVARSPPARLALRRRPRPRTSATRASAPPARPGEPSRRGALARSRAPRRGRSASGRTRPPRARLRARSPPRAPARAARRADRARRRSTGRARGRRTVSGLFAFQSALVSVVIAAQPIETSFRTSHGVTTRTAAATVAPPTSSARLARARGPRDVDGERERKQREARVAEDRQARHGTGRRAERRRAALEREQAEQRQRGEQEAVEDLAVDVDVVPDHVRVQRRQERGGDADPRRAQPPADLEHEQRSRHGDERLRQADREPRVPEGPVETRRGRTRRAAGCTPKARPGGSRTSRSRRASGRSGRSSRRTPRGSAPRSIASTSEAGKRRRGDDEEQGAPRYFARGWRHGATVRGRLLPRRAAARRHASGSATGRCSRDAPGGFRDRLARPPARSGLRRGRGASGSSGRARALRLRAVRPAHALDGARPRPSDRRRSGGAGSRRRRASAAARPAADALLRRRLVHRRGRRRGVRRARLRRLHAALRAAVVPRRRRRLGAAGCARAAAASVRRDAARAPDQPLARLVGAAGHIAAQGRPSRSCTPTSTTPTCSTESGGRRSWWRSACSPAGGRRPTSMPSCRRVAPERARAAACGRGVESRRAERRSEGAARAPRRPARRTSARRASTCSRAGRSLGLVRRAASVVALVALDVAGLALGLYIALAAAPARLRRDADLLEPALARGAAGVAARSSPRSPCCSSCRPACTRRVSVGRGRAGCSARSCSWRSSCSRSGSAPTTTSTRPA